MCIRIFRLGKEGRGYMMRKWRYEDYWFGGFYRVRYFVVVELEEVVWDIKRLWLENEMFIIKILEEMLLLVMIRFRI